MPGVLEHLRFLLEHDVFPTRLLIGVMNKKYFHKMLLPFSIEVAWKWEILRLKCKKAKRVEMPRAMGLHFCGD